MQESSQKENIATAFISCSLRKDDRPFIDYIERILKLHKIEPIGTVGHYSAAPINTAEHMRNNIPTADFIVIVATPRYNQKDIGSGKKTQGIPEMLHVEAGMAYMAEKPVVVFVQKGTNVGNFLPSITQYITLNGQEEDLRSQWTLINSLIKNACDIVRQKKTETANKSFWNTLTAGLAIVGGISILNSLGSENDDDDYE
jgi:hypothetical protein